MPLCVGFGLENRSIFSSQWQQSASVMARLVCHVRGRWRLNNLDFNYWATSQNKPEKMFCFKAEKVLEKRISSWGASGETLLLLILPRVMGGGGALCHQRATTFLLRFTACQIVGNPPVSSAT